MTDIGLPVDLHLFERPPLEMVEVDRKLEFVVDGCDADLALSADREKNGVGGAVQASHCMLVAGRA